MSCCDCIKKIDSREYERVKQKAITHGQEKGFTMVIYKEGEEWKYGEAKSIISAGYPISEIVHLHH